MRARYVAAALLLPLTVLAQSPVEQELLRLENERVDLFKSRKGDWGRFYVDDYTGYLGDGQQRGLAQLKAQKPDPDYAESDLKVIVYRDAALVTAIQVPNGIRARVLRVWAKRPNGWRIVAFQGTPIIARGKADDRTALATATLSSTNTPIAVSSVAREVLKIDEQYMDADRRGDSADSRRMETDRFVFIARSGNVEPPPTAPVRTTPLKDLRMADVRVRTYGDLAVATGEMQWTDQNGFSPGPLRFTRVWVKQAARWKIAAEQRTAITAKPAGSN
jgi:hypothetical protein